MQLGDRVRSTADGQLGVICQLESGGMGVRLDRRGEDRIVPWREGQWAPDTAPRITAMQVARICYDADRAWRLVHGEYAIPDWIAVKEQERLRWMREGVPDGADPRRVHLYLAVRGAVQD